MSVKFEEQHPAALVDEQELPHLLALGRHRRQCKTAHGKRKLAPESKSTGGFSFMRQMSVESSKSLGAGQLEVGLEQASSEDSIASDPGHRAFPLKAQPLKRWRAAAKIQGYLSKWRKGKSESASKESEVSKIEVVECSPSPQSWIQYWPEEPDAPTHHDLEALTDLQSMLIEHHGTMAAAYKFITNCVKNPGSSECNMTKREFRIALHLKASKEGVLPNSPGGDRLDKMFDKLLVLLRRRDGEVSKAEFLRFPELLSREKALQESLTSTHEDLLIGSRLRERFIGPIESPEETRDLFQTAIVALQLEPSRTTNLLFQIGNAPCTSGGNASCSSEIPSGLTSAMSNIMRIAHQFGAPNPGVKLDVLVAAWTLCKALAKQVVALGAPLPSTPEPSNKLKPPNTWMSSKVKTSGRSKSLACKLGRKYQCKQVNPAPDDHQCQIPENEIKAAFWRALPTDEILWNVGCGAEVLNEEDFKTLLRTAWDLFDNFDAVGCLLGPVGWGRMRPKLDALAALNLQQHALGKEQEDAQSHLQNASVLLQQLASMIQADPRLGRIAALFGASFLADRICSTVNRYVNFADEAMGSAAAQLNRSACAITEELTLHDEELLGGRRVECRLSGGEFKIVPAVTTVANPLAEWHQNVTAFVLANATAKRDTDCTKRSSTISTEEVQKLKPAEKYLLGYGNLQGF